MCTYLKDCFNVPHIVTFSVDKFFDDVLARREPLNVRGRGEWGYLYGKIIRQLILVVVGAKLFNLRVKYFLQT